MLQQLIVEYRRYSNSLPLRFLKSYILYSTVLHTHMHIEDSLFDLTQRLYDTYERG
jgi:hypothetical protein